jgi:glycerophosphoryl diester phosphodiesterase
MAPNTVSGSAAADDILPGALYSPGSFDGRGDVVFTGAGADSIDSALASGHSNRIFSGSGEDVVYAGQRDVITGGSGDDEIWATEGDGNRLSGGAGNDSLILGSSDNRALGGAGNDRFYVLGGAGSNTLNGGSGADQFWLITEPGDAPSAKQFVMDFQAGEDKVGLQGVAFSSLSFSQVGANAVLMVAGLEVGYFTNLSTASLNNQTNFAGLAAS